jgi:hypothetical protein
MKFRSGSFLFGLMVHDLVIFDCEKTPNHNSAHPSSKLERLCR